MLIALGGLPGVGKSTIARNLSRRGGVLWLRIDTIERTLRADNPGKTDLMAEGYHIAAALAEENLANGADVIVDAVNPTPYTRDLWGRAAHAAGARLLQVHITCSNAERHRKRVEARLPEATGLNLPDWPAVLARRFDPWPEADVTIDTASQSPDDASIAITEALF